MALPSVDNLSHIGLFEHMPIAGTLRIDARNAHHEPRILRPPSLLPRAHPSLCTASPANSSNTWPCQDHQKRTETMSVGSPVPTAEPIRRCKTSDCNEVLTSTWLYCSYCWKLVICAYCKKKPVSQSYHAQFCSADCSNSALLDSEHSTP